MPEPFYPSDLTDTEWQIIELMLPPNKQRGKQREVDFRQVVNVNFAANLPTTIAVVRPNGAIASYSSGGSDDRPALPFQLLLLNNITIRGVLVYTMPDEAKQMAIRDITAALEAGALRQNTLPNAFH